MWYILRAFRLVSAISVFAVLVMACGEEGPTKTSRQAKDGRVYVRNESEHNTSLDVTITYQDRSRTVRVEPGEREELSEDVIEGGTQITLLMDALGSIANDPTTLKYEIDGDLEIVAISIAGPFIRMEYQRQ